MTATNFYRAFRRGLERRPDGVAVRLADDRSLTYRELDHRSREVARNLAGKLGRTWRVAVCLADPLDVFVATLAVSRTGASLVPLDREAPPEWREHVVEASAPELVLVDADDHDFAGRLERNGVPVADASGTATGAGAVPAVPPRAGGTEAYVLFTSGSTGRPKGVPVSVANLAAFEAAIEPFYELGPDDVVVQLHRLTFDMAVMEMLVAWAAGAVLDVPGPWDFVALHRYVGRRRPTWLLVTPSLARAVRASGRVDPAQWRSLRYLLFGGEALDADSVRFWREIVPDAAIDNYYGPTEVAIACAMWRNRPGDPLPVLSRGRCPMGHAFAGLDVLVEDLGTREDGDVGELLVAGPQVFSGYIGRDAPDAFVRRGGGRYYPTGDVVERDPAHGLVYRHRVDSQVKVRGHRVDLAAVTSVLAEVDGVREARVVLSVEETRQSLVALVVGDAGEEDILARLRTALPRYMVPDSVRVVNAFLVNANGKADPQATLDACRRADAAGVPSGKVV